MSKTSRAGMLGLSLWICFGIVIQLPAPVFLFRAVNFEAMTSLKAP